MPIYTVETRRLNSDTSAYRAHWCYKHDECKENEELGRLCGEEQEIKRKSDPIWTARYSYIEIRTDYTVRYEARNTHDMSEGVVHCEAICYRHHVGRVVSKGVDYNRQVMSDVWDNVPYVVIMNDSMHLETIDTYEGPGYDAFAYLKPQVPENEVDATPEILAAAHVIQEDAKVRQAAEKAAMEAKRAAAAAEAERKAVRKGRTVRVVKGRKVPKGTEGVCFWIGDSGYGRRVGMKVNGETVWVDAANVEAV